MTTRVVPSGAPFWARTTTFAHYGGHANKAEYAGVAAVGGDTDLAAADFNRLPTDLAAIAKTCPFCVIRYTGRESSSLSPLVEYCALAPVGVYISEPYPGITPPTGYPTVELSGTDAVVTLLASYRDAYSVAQAFTITAARVSSNDTSGTDAAILVAVTSNTVTSRVVGETTGTVAQDKTVTLEIW